MAQTVWTEKRKWAGNLLPALFWLPPSLAGVFWIAFTAEPIGPGLALLGVGTVTGWLALNQFGFWQNGRMRRALERVLQAEGESLPIGRSFVGFATPRHHGLLDAHEDVGFVWCEPDRVVFRSESRRVELLRKDVREVRLRPNVHSMLGLGGWVSLEGIADGRPVRMLLEPRERTTMLANSRRRAPLRDRLQRWLKDPGPKTSA